MFRRKKKYELNKTHRLNYRNGSSKAADLPLEVRQAGLALLYQIGKAVLEKQNIFEE
jgi:hypothetical protein